jgi:hypothetical protein
MCLSNVILCLMLGLLSIFFNALCKVMFSFLFATSTILIVALSAISMRCYAKGKLYPFSNLVLCNPFVFFPMTWDNIFCAIVSCHFILLIICFCPFVFHGEFFNFSSSSIYLFEFLMQWHFVPSFYDIVVIFSFSFSLDGYFPKKCAFCVNYSVLLGHIVCSDGLLVDPRKITIIITMQVLDNVTTIKRFLEVVGFYQCYFKTLPTKRHLCANC